MVESPAPKRVKILTLGEAIERLQRKDKLYVLKRLILVIIFVLRRVIARMRVEAP
jgi:hypothetical protein